MGEILEFFVGKALLQFKINNIKFAFYLIGNESINATFLARYIANKFRQNLSLRRVLNPLSREFRRVTHIYHYDSKLISAERSLSQRQFDNKIALKRAWGLLFGPCSDGFSSYLVEYFNKSCTWSSLDMLILYVWVSNKFTEIEEKLEEEEEKSEEEKKKLKEKRLYFSTYLTNRLNAFFIIYMTDIKNWVLNLSAFTLERYVIDISMYNNWNYFFNFILQHILINKSCFNKINLFKQYVPLITKLASRSYYRFIKYNYWSVNYKLWHSINAFNYLKARQEVENAPTNLFRGFKIHCLGRFSRRQRAKSFWLHLGMVPLNKYKANIDYSHYTMPIKNSLISIKVWVHMVRSNDDVPDIDYKYT